MKTVTYSFDDFVLNAHRYTLERGSEVVKMRPKTFQTLLYLVEHRDRLVEKSEILDHVWAGSVVTEGTLTHCVKEIRDALGDDASQPHYLKTVHRVGYQFIGAATEVAAAHGRTGTEPPDAVRPFSKRRRRIALGTGLFVLALLSFLVYHRMDRAPSISFTERGWLLISDFDDLSDEPALAVALRMALEQEMAQSKYVNVVPIGRVFDTLQLMKRDPNTHVDEALGREICLRDGGIQALLSGRVVRVGERYSISTRLIDPNTGEAVFTLVQEARQKDELLPAISTLAQAVRSRLGEPRFRMSKTTPALAHVTTSSLKALTFFSRSWRAHEQFDWKNTQRFAEEAVRVDSTFAMAHLALAYALLWQGHLPDAQSHFRRAAALATGLSDRERYFILGSAAAYGRGDTREAIANYELLVQLYPDDYWGHQNLSQAYSWTGDFENYEKHKRAGLEIRPNYAISHYEFGVGYFFQGDIDAASRQFKHALRLNPDLPIDIPHLAPAFQAWMAGDFSGAEEEISNYLGDRDPRLLNSFRVTARWFIARFYLYQGRPEIAVGYLKEGLGWAKGSTLAGWTRLELGLTYRAMGQRVPFERLLNQVAREEVGLLRVQALGWLAIAAARSERGARALQLRTALLGENQQMPVTLLQPPIAGALDGAKLAFRNQIDGERALAAGDTSKAVAYFRTVISLVPPVQRPALSVLDARLNLVAHQALAHIFSQKQNWRAAIKENEAIFYNQFLTIIAPAAGRIWQDARLSLTELRLKVPSTDGAGRMNPAG